MKPYFEKTNYDVQFYNTYIRDRIPARIFDFHIHINLKEHMEMVPLETIMADWALECGSMLPYDDAIMCLNELFPNIQIKIAGFPWPIYEADLIGNNKYLAKKAGKGLISPLMCVRPEWNTEYIEKVLLEGNFSGFKPYPYMASRTKGSDISIFDFIPHKQLEILNRYKKNVVIHLPRAERLADKQNITELLEIRQRYPDIRIVIAHFGRSFCPYYLEEGLRKMGNESEGFYFDTAAVINPDVYRIAFDKLSPSKIIYGTDLPIFFWHGRRNWTAKKYINRCRENYTWNKIHESPECENTYTLFLYEQVRVMLDMIEKMGLSEDHKKLIFHDNAENISK